MKTILLSPKTDADAVEKAAALLRAGEVVGIPTETVYGLAANALDTTAVAKIFQAKGRPQDNPLIVHIAALDQMAELAAFIPSTVPLLAQAFCPGPLTMIVPRSDKIPDVVSGGLDTVGIRLPAHPLARALIQAAGVPLAAPSANRSGRPSTTTAAHVLQDMDGKIAAILDGGACTVGVESTVVSLVGDKPRLLRPGGITREQLESVLGEIEVDRALYETIREDAKVSAPGMKYRHYAPRAPVTVVRGAPDKTAQYIQQQVQALSLTQSTVIASATPTVLAPSLSIPTSTRTSRVHSSDSPSYGVLCFDEYQDWFPSCVVRCFGQQDDIATQAQMIFDCLRAFDETDVQQIWAQCPPDDGLGLAVANRIQKAAGFRIHDVP